MKVQEVKLRIETFGLNLIDKYFTNTTILSKVMNASVKYIMHLNLYRLDDILKMFADQNNEIDIDELIKCYSAALFNDGKLEVDLCKLIPQENLWISSLMPLKLIIFNEEDLKRIFR